MMGCLLRRRQLRAQIGDSINLFRVTLQRKADLPHTIRQLLESVADVGVLAVGRWRAAGPVGLIAIAASCHVTRLRWWRLWSCLLIGW